MKRRKRMGIPKERPVPSCGSVDRAKSSVPPEIIDILRDRVRRLDRIGKAPT
jgi:hypothetical protein